MLSKAINAYLHLDEESPQRLKKLQGKCITIELLPLPIKFQCTFNDQGVTLQNGAPEHANTTLRGTPLQMLGVMLTKENRHSFFADDLSIEGDAEFAQQVIELFDNLQIDWEEHLSHLIGDVPTYHVGRFMRGMRKWLNGTTERFAQDINEYVHEEAAWLPAREALQDLFADIDALRMDVDRMEAKIAAQNHKGEL
jgi:ubiquinone biosynthesis protein UbiJ